MSDGFLFWYESDWTPQRARECVGRLDAAGLSPAHPTTGRITAISTAEETLGEQVPIDRATLLRRAAVDSAVEFSFQYWIDVDIDVFCTVERLAPQLVAQRLYLDGLTTEQTLLVVRIVVDEIRTAPGPTRGLIVDRTGGSVAEDWDTVIAGTPERIAVRADIMGLPRSVAAQHPEVHTGATVAVGDLVLFDPDGLLPND